MPPGPSEPASMPITRNKSKAGRPIRPDARVATMLSRSRPAPIIRFCSKVVMECGRATLYARYAGVKIHARPRGASKIDDRKL